MAALAGTVNLLRLNLNWAILDDVSQWLDTKIGGSSPRPAETPVFIP